MHDVDHHGHGGHHEHCCGRCEYPLLPRAQSSPFFINLVCSWMMTPAFPLPPAPLFSSNYVVFFLTRLFHFFCRPSLTSFCFCPSVSSFFFLFVVCLCCSLLFPPISPSHDEPKKKHTTQAFMRLDENLTRFNSLFVGDGPNRLFVYFQPADQANEASTPLFVKCSYPFIFWSSEHVQHE